MPKIIGYYDSPTAGFGAAGLPVSYFNTPPAPFYADWRSEPVPGWGARPVMAGPRMVGVGEAPSSEHPAMRALKDEAARLYPNNPAMQTAHVLAKGPGLARTVDQWLASPDSAPYRQKAASDAGLMASFNALSMPVKAAVVLVPLALLAYFVIGKKG